MAYAGEDQGLRRHGLRHEAEARGWRQGRHAVMDARYPEIQFRQSRSIRLVQNQSRLPRAEPDTLGVGKDEAPDPVIIRGCDDRRTGTTES